MDLFIPFWCLEMAALAVYFFLVVRAMRTFGYRLLFLLTMVLVIAIVTLQFAILGAYVIGWLKVRRWALRRTMCCWTASIIVPLSMIVIGQDAAYPYATVAAAAALGLSLWCWKGVERMRGALHELLSSPSPEASRRMAELGALSVGPLRTVLRDGHREARFAAIAALGQINSRGARHALNDARYDSDPDIRSVAQLWLTLAAPEPA
jgi:hypothetical protein